MSKHIVHPYMPNSTEQMQREMLKTVGVDSIESIYKSVIPEDLIFKGHMNLPDPILSEAELKKHVMSLLDNNVSCQEYISFLGAGCYNRYIPAICDEIVGRAEFLTAYTGGTYSDHGKMQAIFEGTSMLGELLNMDVVSSSLYDGGQAVCSSMRMALRIKKERQNILIPETMNPEIFSQADAYCEAFGKLIKIKTKGGVLDIDDYKKNLTEDTAAVFIENPTFLGNYEEKAEEIINLAHNNGSLAIVMPSLTSLGIVTPPADYGADIVCGEIQELGIHMNYGGGCAGFIATSADDTYVSQYSTYLYGLADTKIEGQYGWGRALNYRVSHEARENANEYYGTAAGLWTIMSAVYLAVMGPQGIKETAELITRRAAYAEKKLKEIPLLKVNFSEKKYFQEFIVDFSDTSLSVKEINKQLLDHGIFGGADLTTWFPEYANCALYCFGEMTDADSIDTLCQALKDILELPV